MLPIVVRALLPFVAVAMAQIAGAQLAEVTPGVRVRLRAPERFGAPVTGIVLERHGDTLKVSPPKGEAVVVRIGELERVEISRGKSRMLGAGVGALWGAGIYGVMGLALGVGDCSGCEFEIDAFDATVAFALSGAITGVMIGGLIGKERWERLAWPRQVGVEVGGGRIVVRGRVGW